MKTTEASVLVYLDEVIGLADDAVSAVMDLYRETDHIARHGTMSRLWANVFADGYVKHLNALEESDETQADAFCGAAQEFLRGRYRDCASKAPFKWALQLLFPWVLRQEGDA